MNKVFHSMMFVYLVLGQMIFLLSSIFRHSLTDFQLGFCQGISIVFIIVGLMHLSWWLSKKKNLYKIQ